MNASFSSSSREDFQSQICIWPGQSEGDMATALRLFRLDDEEPAETTVEVSFSDAVTRYAAARHLEWRTVAEYQTTCRKLADWYATTLAGQASAHRSMRPRVGDLDRDAIAAFLTWVGQQAQEHGNPGRVVNKAREHLRAVLRWLVATEQLAAMPKIPEKREQRTAAGLFFLTDEELEKLYWATYRLRKPHGWPHAAAIGAYWRAALAVFVTYGVDTQLVFPMHQRSDRLRWRNVHGPGLSPDRSTKQESPHGWLAWSRQKTGHPFCAPLTEIVAAHLRVIRPAEAQADDTIFGQSGGGRPCQRFQTLVRLARISEKRDPRSGELQAWTLKDLRKTCATRHDENCPGSSSIVLGHAADGIAEVTRKHYTNPGPQLFRAVTTLSYPRAFHAVLDESIRPPNDLLFAT